MGFISIILAIAYAVISFRILSIIKKNKIQKNNKMSNFLRTDYNIQFSTKPEQNFTTTLAISLVCIIWMSIMINTGNVNMGDFDDMGVTLLVLASFICFIMFGAYSVYYGWVAAHIAGERLIIQDDKIAGTYLYKIKGMKFELVDMEVKISDIKEVVVIKQGKVLGLELVSLNIRTQSHIYEFLMPVDADGIKSIIEKRMSL